MSWIIELKFLLKPLLSLCSLLNKSQQHEGESAEIICPYDSIYKSKPKSLCKGKFSLETIRDDRFSFSDEASTGVFTVNITDLREEDSGIYWCGAHVITKASLTVKIGKKSLDKMKTCLLTMFMTYKNNLWFLCCSLSHNQEALQPQHSGVIKTGNCFFSTNEQISFHSAKTCYKILLYIENKIF
uniref:Ig-like domain-containing protein n=1 Tax=Sinocyclocheilus anshuiensis TaxID=1608454 RepID=A0A671NH75_9TELE